MTLTDVLLWIGVVGFGAMTVMLTTMAALMVVDMWKTILR